MKPNPFRKPSAKEEMAEGEAPMAGKKPGFVSKMKTNMGMKKKMNAPLFQSGKAGDKKANVMPTPSGKGG